MKKIISLLILCSTIAYGIEETYPTVYSFPGAESSIPTILYLQSGSGGSMVAAKINGRIFDTNISMPTIVDDIKHYSPSFEQMGIIVRSEEDYDQCKRALEERCGKGIEIKAKMPKEMGLIKDKVEEIDKLNERFTENLKTLKKTLQHEEACELLKLIQDPNNRQ